MKWENGRCRRCRLTDKMTACVYQSVWTNSWFFDVEFLDEEGRENGTLEVGMFASEAAAKSAVAAWIGKTMAQLSNALAAGEPRVDEE